jgi:hypothetical protein
MVTLAEAAGLNAARAQALLGTKAANLARLAGTGLPVPAGVVVTPTAAADWELEPSRGSAATATFTSPVTAAVRWTRLRSNLCAGRAMRVDAC